jgi:nucleoid DNA-binding protein
MEQRMPDVISKSELIQKIAEKCSNNLTRDEVKQVLDALADIGHAELGTTGAFLLPGFAKFVVVKKPATPARDGVNPFTKEPMRFEAKPASRAIKARPVKAIKDAVS